MADLTPEHTARHPDSSGYPEVIAAYRYVESVISTADAQSPIGGHAWHGWALREAFLAGCTHVHASLSQSAPPADGEVAELVEWLQEEADDYECIGCEESAARCNRAAELLQRQVLVPVSVSERPWEREGWCDGQGRCWLGSDSVVPDVSAWIYGPAVWAERFPDIHRLLLPAHALPLPEVSE